MRSGGSPSGSTSCPWPFAGSGRECCPFDARETPNDWLAETTGQAPGDTVRELRECGAAEDAALDDRLAGYTDAAVNGPYGEVHWTILSAHVVWDAWLHARDVTEVVGGGGRSTPVEDELVAFYSLLIASMPAVPMGYPLDLTVAVTAEHGARYMASVVPGSVTLRTSEVGEEANLEGNLPRVADALARRSLELEAALHGEQSALEPLSWLRTRLLPAG